MYAEAANDWEKAREIDPANPKLVINYKHVPTAVSLKASFELTIFETPRSPI